MLQFAESWSWIVKAFVALLFLLPLATLIIFFKKRFGVGGEMFFFAWGLGVSAAFVMFAGTYSGGMKNLTTPFVPFLIIFAIGVALGGVSTILVSQAIPAAPNPALPWVILGVNTPLSYVVAYWASRISPENFPVVEFSWINFAGMIILFIGLALALYRPN